jgi:hypothetical protein
MPKPKKTPATRPQATRVPSRPLDRAESDRRRLEFLASPLRYRLARG